MANLNFKHLRYFWAVATHGTITHAAEVLHVTPQTISGQLGDLEDQVGVKHWPQRHFRLGKAW